VSKLRVGVIGCRGIGVRHAAGLEDLDNVELIAGCDLSGDELKVFTESHGARWPNLQTFSDSDEMLAKCDLDIVTIATGDNTHTKLVLAAVEAGARGIFCEKPLATSLEEADRMVEACAASNTILSVDHTRRWMSNWTHAWHLIHEQGAIGEVQYVISQLTGPRAMLFRNGTHLLDIICYYAQSEPLWVMADLEEGFEDYTEYRGDGGKTPEKEPAASGYIRFANGVRGFFPCGTKKASKAAASVQVIGTEGVISLGSNTLAITRDEETEQDITPPLQKYEGIVAGVRELVRLVAEGGTPVSPGTEAVKAIEIISGFLESQRQGNAPVQITSLRT